MRASDPHAASGGCRRAGEPGRAGGRPGRPFGETGRRLRCRLEGQARRGAAHQLRQAGRGAPEAWSCQARPAARATPGQRATLSEASRSSQPKRTALRELGGTCVGERRQRSGSHASSVARGPNRALRKPCRVLSVTGSGGPSSRWPRRVGKGGQAPRTVGSSTPRLHGAVTAQVPALVNDPFAFAVITIPKPSVASDGLSGSTNRCGASIRLPWFRLS
jgi:hypothetical protein